MHYPQSHERKSFKVSEISKLLKQLVEESFYDVQIIGEVSGFKISNLGHGYFALKDEQAVINAICWQNVLSTLQITIADGIELICTGRISTYSNRSSYQFIVQKIEVAGQGALLAQTEKLKNKLMSEGLFDQEHKKPLPYLPNKIGVITSLTGAVLQDIAHRVLERFPTELLVWNVTVQGTEAATQITQAIQGFNSLPNHITTPDVIIIARGGGSIEDLWAFNQEAVVRAIAHSSIPIISAVGHEVDYTLCDLAADARAPTPTAAIELALPTLQGIYNHIQTTNEKIVRHVYLSCQSWHLQLANCFLELKNFQNVFHEKTTYTTNLYDKIFTITMSTMQTRYNALSLLKEKVEKYDQTEILKMGFALLQNIDRDLYVTSVADIKIDSNIIIKMHDGAFQAVVRKKI